MLLDINSQNEVKVFISAVAPTDDTPVVSSIIDLQGYSAAEFLLSLGTLADTNATFTVLFEQGDDAALADNTTVAAADLLGAPANFTFAADGTVQQWGYRGSKRYVRLTITPSGNTGAAPMAAVAFLRKKKVGSTL